MERGNIYRWRPPEGIQVPIMVTPAAVGGGVMEEADIEQAVMGLKGGRAGGLYVIWVEYLKRWFWEASRENNLVRIM